jgi:hypothetical protein
MMRIPPTWQAGSVRLFAGGTDERIGLRIERQNLQVTGVESADYTLSGNVLCSVGDLYPASALASDYTDWLDGSLPNLCADPGPGYMTQCTQDG